jgi:hypothetical protein
MWAPSEIESIAMSDNELSGNQTMVVVYPRVEGELPNREQVTQPYGLIFEDGLSNFQMFVASSVLDVDLDLYPTVGDN